MDLWCLWIIYKGHTVATIKQEICCSLLVKGHPQNFKVNKDGGK